MALEERAKIKDLEQESLPFRFGKGVREFGQNVIRPAGSATMDALTLPSRAVGFGVGEAFRGFTGRPQGPGFDVRPLTTQAFEASKPDLVTPTMPDQSMATGLRAAPVSGIQPELPQTGLPQTGLPQAGPITAPEVLPTGEVPGGIRDVQPTDAAVTAEPETGIRWASPSKKFVTMVEPVTGRKITTEVISGSDNPPALREPYVDPSIFEGGAPEMAVANAGIADYNNALLSSYSKRNELWKASVGGVPKDVAQAGLFEAQAQEAPLEGGSRRGLRSAQTAAATRSAEQANLIKVNVDVPTGEFNALNEPIMAKKQMLYNPETQETIDPTEGRRAAVDTSPVASLRAEYAKMSDAKQKIVEKHFAGRTDVTADEVMTYIKDINK